MAQNFTKQVFQLSHGFSDGDAIAFNSIYFKAQGDSVPDAENFVGFVTSVQDVNNFVFEFGGLTTVQYAGLVSGRRYYLDAASPGRITITPPSAPGDVIKPVLLATGTNTGFILYSSLDETGDFLRIANNLSDVDDPVQALLNIGGIGAATTNTLTNKTLDGGSNTFTNIPAAALTGITSVDHGGTGNSNRTLTDASSVRVLDWSTQSLYDHPGNPSLNWSSRTLSSVGGTTVTMNWGRQIMWDQNDAQSIDWLNRILSDSTIPSIVKSLDWNARQLFANDGTTVNIDWSAAGATTINGLIPISASSTNILTNKSMSGLSNTFTNLPATGLTGIVPVISGGTGNANRTVTDSSGRISINWQARTMFDSTPSISADYNQRVLIDQSDVGSIYWGNDASGRQLTDAIGYIAIDWKNRLLKDNALPQLTSVDWQNRKLYKSDGATVSFDWNATLAENTIYVSNGGNDSTGNGSSLNPYLTIAHALSTITTASLGNTFLIRVSAGIFNETTIALKPWVSIEGSGYFTTIINATNPIILSSADWTGLSGASLTIMKVNTNASAWAIDFDALNASGNEIDFVDFYNPSGDMSFTGKTGAPCLVTFFQSQAYVANLNFTNANIFMSDSFTEAYASFTNAATGGTVVSSYFIAGQNLNTLVSSSDLTSTNVCQYFGMDIPGITESGAGTSVVCDAVSYKKPSLSGGATISPQAIGTSGISVKEGTNAKQGVATLVGGTVTVANTSVTANSRIIYSVQSPGGVQGFLSATKIASTSFTINSTNVADTSTIVYQIFEPA